MLGDAEEGVFTKVRDLAPICISGITIIYSALQVIIHWVAVTLSGCYLLLPPLHHCHHPYPTSHHCSVLFLLILILTSTTSKTWELEPKVVVQLWPQVLCVHANSKVFPMSCVSLIGLNKRYYSDLGGPD